MSYLINYHHSFKLYLISGKDLAPENVDEFDKLVLTSPDSSLCWIQYIAFHMERKDYTLARTVVKRALEKINFREEKERFNIYMAWFNLENNFGTEDDTNKVFKEALQCNDEYKVIYVYMIKWSTLGRVPLEQIPFSKKLLQKNSFNILFDLIIAIR